MSAVDKELNHPNHNIRNGDEIVLTHMMSKKNVHTSPAYESPVSKNAEVSLCMSSGSHGCLEDVWKLELIDPQVKRCLPRTNTGGLERCLDW